ncbi:hypothetical protein TVAG_102410 [Trichomonas vaginalis G3]|uniref:Uncharacterized protein n=1 Tax=Trichomonas vaginalis (strain ATCC PRA-98 / G3) TaxID=412133 RepID=A2ECU7_TRIV3|nr:sulfurtransferase-related family [Trichomonas vaginalis G3]EAY09492.1 hypothetical protein TVAG_102410 [Trichomonas vaginalis G3]KAI5521423.1 sulfurtransferase-related family [Trichomonas vaginalis G3]|eukprot:XP_001321715.1 hypothetical protein [Trichomonas vaginalis G3]
MMQKFPRIRKQFGKAVAEFHLILSQDKILVPIDADAPRLTLAAWIYLKKAKMIQKCEICAAHFYSSDNVDPETQSILDDFIKQYPMDIKYVHHDDVTDRESLHRMYVEYALEENCNKVAVPDTIELMNATMLATMCTDCVLNGPDPAQKVQLAPDAPEITIIRPFCYLKDADLLSFTQKNLMKTHKAGIDIEEENEVIVCRETIKALSTEASNTNYNIFHSQFVVQEKYLGGGDGLYHELGDFDKD